MKVLAILANHDKNSLSSRIFYQVTHHLAQNGAQVDILDLYERQDEIPFYVGHKPDQSPTLHTSTFFHENKERFLAADKLLIVYPIYWYAVPGILKCWFDLITTFAWKFTGKSKTQPLHKIKHAFIINSSMESWWHRRFLTTNPSRRQISQTFDFIGIPNYDFYEIGSTHTLKQAQITGHINAIIARSKKLLT
ncbi:NAD(P)H-dependent oxidoreductase [Candidatus Dependentiae bacterium]|jgi:NAD(P)H dehydrogenase (quinone)|nr:NAD(P)H-dependent oxidoreductase [Candidatus Dependentiae bacterium]